MNGLPGNPHEEDAMNYSCEAADINSWATAEERLVLAQQATAHAVLALAYEQRTANMIESNKPSEIDFTNWPKPLVGRFTAQAIEIAKRLGVGKTK